MDDVCLSKEVLEAIVVCLLYISLRGWIEFEKKDELDYIASKDLTT